MEKEQLGKERRVQTREEKVKEIEGEKKKKSSVKYPRDSGK